MSDATYREATKAVSSLLDCVGPYYDDHAVDQAKIAVSHIQHGEMIRQELLKALENLERTAGLPSMSDDPVRVTARAAIAKAKGEQE